MQLLTVLLVKRQSRHLPIQMVQQLRRPSLVQQLAFNATNVVPEAAESNHAMTAGSLVDETVDTDKTSNNKGCYHPKIRRSHSTLCCYASKSTDEAAVTTGTSNDATTAASSSTDSNDEKTTATSDESEPTDTDATTVASESTDFGTTTAPSDATAGASETSDVSASSDAANGSSSAEPEVTTAVPENVESKDAAIAGTPAGTPADEAVATAKSDNIEGQNGTDAPSAEATTESSDVETTTGAVDKAVSKAKDAVNVAAPDLKNEAEVKTASTIMRSARQHCFSNMKAISVPLDASTSLLMLQALIRTCEKT
uniref:Uncharacterized protein n=1 Tax=Panagrellus redivivus TaxID=6233 RepID=A0A7E4ZR72_PANRE